MALEPVDKGRFDAAVRASYREAGAPDSGAEARLLERLTSPHRGGLGWWLDSQRLALRPIVALFALLVTLAIGVWTGERLATRARRQPTAVAALTQGIPVTFALRAPGAASVAVAGDFNGWDAAATPLAHAGTGDLWIVRVTLPSGVHHYSFVLDGAEWRPDPSAPLAADDAFGGHNSVIVVQGTRTL